MNLNRSALTMENVYKCFLRRILLEKLFVTYNISKATQSSTVVVLSRTSWRISGAKLNWIIDKAFWSSSCRCYNYGIRLLVFPTKSFLQYILSKNSHHLHSPNIKTHLAVQIENIKFCVNLALLLPVRIEIN